MSDSGLDAEQNVRTRAYLLWEAAGKPDGSTDEYWYCASDRIEAEAQSAYPPPQSMAHRA